MHNRNRLSLLANMGHTFRTPLNQILGYTEILQEQIAGGLNERQLKHVTSVSHAGNVLLDVVNDLIDLAQLETGKATLVLAACPLHDTINEVVEQLRLRAKEKQLDVSIQMGDATRAVEADRQWLTRLFSSLFANALTVAEVGSSVVVTSRSAGGSPTQDHVMVSIRVERSDLAAPETDDEATDLEHLAGLYERVCHGFGIRLALADCIARHHRGSLRIDTTGTQSAFTISAVLPHSVESQTGSPKSVVEGVRS